MLPQGSKLGRRLKVMIFDEKKVLRYGFPGAEFIGDPVHQPVQQL
jgi:hypothetical protein